MEIEITFPYCAPASKIATRSLAAPIALCALSAGIALIVHTILLQLKSGGKIGSKKLVESRINFRVDFLEHIIAGQYAKGHQCHQSQSQDFFFHFAYCIIALALFALSMFV